MPLSCQKHLFTLAEDVHYLNCSYMSPLLRSAEEAGIEGVRSKRNPFQISPAGFFSGAAELKPLFAQLIGATADRIALIPSVSYGMAIVAKNLRIQPGQNLVTVHEVFPSNRYPWERVCAESHATLRAIQPPDTTYQNRGKQWNERILEAIDKNTVLVALPHVHWADGTRFDLEAIRRRAKEVGALLAVDGTQSVGALAFDVRKFRPDALICGGYKWLMGPYSLGVAYLGDYFDEGVPLEESWMNRLNSDNFQKLIDYESQYRPGAARYDVGEQSNFVLVPMLTAALRQILDWGTDSIQAYCQHLTAPLVSHLQANDFQLEDATWRGEHLLGIRLPAEIDMRRLQELLAQRKVMVSVRGNAMRVSPHVYNTEDDIAAFISVLQEGK